MSRLSDSRLGCDRRCACGHAEEFSRHLGGTHETECLRRSMAQCVIERNTGPPSLPRHATHSLAHHQITDRHRRRSAGKAFREHVTAPFTGISHPSEQAPWSSLPSIRSGHPVAGCCDDWTPIPIYMHVDLRIPSFFGNSKSVRVHAMMTTEDVSPTRPLAEPSISEVTESTTGLSNVRPLSVPSLLSCRSTFPHDHHRQQHV